MSLHRSLFVVPAAALLATAAIAGDGGVRVAVGDLNRPEAARDFYHRLSVAADRFCADRGKPEDLLYLAACRASIRDQAIAQLSQEQRQALLDALGPKPQFAAR
jgi:UrcA family protein